MQEYYKVLKIDENASDEQIDEAYKKLKAQYSKDRFLEGEAGNQAAKNLTKLEIAYTEIKANRANSDDFGFSGNIGEVERLIKEGDLNKAQQILDDITERNAKWHYVQSVLFYKKNWINESKKQLEIAINMDPDNEKYKDSYQKLIAKINSNSQHFHSGNANYSNTSTQNAYNDRQMGGSSCSTFVDCCTTWCCMNLLCNSCR